MANLKVSIIEKIKVDGTWKSVPATIPKSKPNGKGFYLKDCREGNFLLVWREDGQKRYSSYIPTLPDAIRAKEQKELYLASLANGLTVEDPSEGQPRLTDGHDKCEVGDSHDETCLPRSTEISQMFDSER